MGLLIYGSSDDLIEFESDVPILGIDPMFPDEARKEGEWNTPITQRIPFRLTGNGRVTLVTIGYFGVWAIGVRQEEEDVLIHPGNIFSKGYSARLVLEGVEKIERLPDVE